MCTVSKAEDSNKIYRLLLSGFDYTDELEIVFNKSHSGFSRMLLLNTTKQGNMINIKINKTNLHLLDSRVVRVLSFVVIGEQTCRVTANSTSR